MIKKQISFFIKDTYNGDSKDPLSLNLYAYCANNPLIYVDPTGHMYGYFDENGQWVGYTHSCNPAAYTVGGYNSADEYEYGSLYTSERTIIHKRKYENEDNVVSNVFDGADRLINYTKEDLAIVDQNGSIPEKIVAHGADIYINWVARPVVKIIDMPFNAVRTGFKYGWAEDNLFLQFPQMIKGLGVGLAGGYLDISPKYMQNIDYPKEWLTGSISEAYSYSHPEAGKYFEEHPFVKSLVDSTEILVPLGGEINYLKQSNKVFEPLANISKTEVASKVTGSTGVGNGTSSVIRENVLKNIAESKAARESSTFGGYIARENAWRYARTLKDQEVTMVSAVYGGNGKTYINVSGDNLGAYTRTWTNEAANGINNARNKAIQQGSFARDGVTPSLERWTIENCGDIKAVNDAIADGASKSKMFGATIRVKPLFKAEPEIIFQGRCKNCQITTEGVWWYIQ
ncbi:RHS repeat-associated core domain-containing protein [Acetivibrio cellulolyticus]|uniref:hypothetical protein n=1 Tax=Acetivibrio cellulolyticus TaxID=35830 RepID=UPI0001E2CCD6|nr:hypothetical protein [Acetivibrio cellulolyticus]